MDLKDLGWCDFFARPFAALDGAGWVPARVTIQHRGGYQLYDGNQELAAEVSGRFRHHARCPGDFPVVGDWVAVEALAGEPKAMIHAVLPRRTHFSRTTAGDATDQQVLAANVDMAMVVASLSGDLNLRRMERYLTLARESRATPCVVLTKLDLCPEASSAIARVQVIAGDATVLAVSSRTGKGIRQLKGLLKEAETSVLLGPSGVGKSSLVNQLYGDETLDVQPVRETDQKGRHTTTRRELVYLPGGSLIIDTPGLRELQLWEGETGLKETFDDIQELAVGCRFTDCRHDAEPGCAVRKAVEEGRLEPGRLESQKKLRTETEAFERKAQVRRQAEGRRRRASNGPAGKPRSSRS